MLPFARLMWGGRIQHAAFFANFIPLFTAILSTLILGEPPQGFHGLAFFLIVIGIGMSSTLKSKERLSN